MPAEEERRQADPLIVKVIQAYHPTWTQPRGTGRDWISCLCPWHGDESPSASVSLVHDAFKCFVCDASGNAIRIIMREEGISYQQAVKHAEEIAPGGYKPVSRKSARKPRRRTFGESGFAPSGGEAEDRPVQARVRGRASPWS